jgi:hypothetical protein
MCPLISPAFWALVDANNFYASCERLFRPDLVGKPIVVLSNNDGCIVARSNEAKALGIGMGEPEFKVRGLLKQHAVTVFSSNYALYGDISSRVMRTMESLVPLVEQYSIDEAFLPLSGSLAANADEIAAMLRERIRKWTGIVVSVGVGPTRVRRAGHNTLAHGALVMKALVTAARLGAAAAHAVVTKGGITSAAVVGDALGARGALVVGQVAAGVSLWLTDPGAVPVVIVPGNVGGPDALIHAVEAVGGSRVTDSRLGPDATDRE